MKNKMHLITQSCLLFIWVHLQLMDAEESDVVRLVGGTSHCMGIVEMNHMEEWMEEWKPVAGWDNWNLKASIVVCRQLNCGSVASTKMSSGPDQPVWWTKSSCVGSESSVGECVKTMQGVGSRNRVEVVCSESVRLVNGASLCSGRVEIMDQLSWVSVCEGDFDQQDAEVVCRELGCGAPSVLQGALYGEAKAPVGTKEFQCEGSESALLDCGTSDSIRDTCSPDKTVGLTCSEPDNVRLVGGTSHCAGTLEMKHQGKWKPVTSRVDWSLKSAAAVCRQLDCGSAISTELSYGSRRKSIWLLKTSCVGSESSLRECGTEETHYGEGRIGVVCSESVRLVNGNSWCSGRVEVKSSNQSWVSVCEGDFDQQDAEVVCKELGCGAPSVLQGALYGAVKAPMSTKEFRCEGSETSLRNCESSDSTRNNCSPDKTIGLTCSEPDVRLVGGECAGRLEIKHEGEWRPVEASYSWNQNSSAVACRQLGCGSALSTEEISDSKIQTWRTSSSCVGSESSLRDCITKSSDISAVRLDLICSESVRLVNGSSLCSGRMEVKSNQLWVPVCEDAFDEQDADVVCRELDCGARSVLQGVHSGEVKAPMWTKELQCEGNETVLLNCATSSSTKTTCSTDKTVGLTCREPDDLRLVGGTSNCNGTLEMKHKLEWRPVHAYEWTQMLSAVVCRQLDCGSAISAENNYGGTSQSVTRLNSYCVGSESSLRECVRKEDVTSSGRVELICSEQDVRLVGGTSKCTGALEMKHKGEWRPVTGLYEWSLKPSAVVCRQLHCGSAISAELSYGLATSKPVWRVTSVCAGSESSLRECVRKEDDTSSGRVELICSAQ